MNGLRRAALAAPALALALLAGAAAPTFARTVQQPPSDANLSATTPADPSAAVADLPAVDAPDADAPLIMPPPPSDGPSGIAARLADWVTGARDNGDLPFMIVDKLAADVFAFDADGNFLGSAPVLVGLARGDDSAPGIGDLALAAISPDERTTPAGRFLARFGPTHRHGTVLWIDYRDAISMHPVMSVSPKEQRQRRIRSADPAQHRISYGCVNVPATFYHDVVQVDFAGGRGVVYVLPDTQPLADFFPAFAAAAAGGDADQTAQAASADPLSADAGEPIADPDPAQVSPVDDLPQTPQTPGS